MRRVYNIWWILFGRVIFYWRVPMAAATTTDLSPVCFDDASITQSFCRTCIDGNARSEIVSLMQKAVRRCDARLARYATAVMVGSQQIERAVTRFLVMIGEDIGVADPWLAVEVLTVLDSLYYPRRAVKTPSGTMQPWRFMRNEVGVRHFMMALATRFANAEKCRLGSNCSHGYFCVQPEHGDCDSWPLTSEERNNSMLMMTPFIDIAIGAPGAAQRYEFEPMMQRAGYLLAANEKVTAERFCKLLVSCYARRRPEHQNAQLLCLLRALERVRELRSGGDPSKGRCIVVHMFYLIWAIDRGEYVLPAPPVDCIQSVLSCYSREDAEADFARIVTGAWREATLPAYVKDSHAASAPAPHTISVAEWMLREDQALRPCNVVIVQNAAALDRVREQEALVARRVANAEMKSSTSKSSTKRKTKANTAAITTTTTVVVVLDDDNDGDGDGGGGGGGDDIAPATAPAAKKQALAVPSPDQKAGDQQHYCQGMGRAFASSNG